MESVVIIIKWLAIYLIGVLLSMQPFYMQNRFHDYLKEDKQFKYCFYSSFLLPYVWFVIFWIYAIILYLVGIVVAIIVSVWEDIIKKYVLKKLNRNDISN